MHITPRRADRELAKELDKLQDMVGKLQNSSEANPSPRHSHNDTTLIQCAREVIVKGTTMYETSLAAESIVGGQGGAASRNSRVAEWVSTLESIRQDQRLAGPSDEVPNVPSTFFPDESNTVVLSTTSRTCAMKESEAVDALEDNSDDDLDIDLAKAALDTGTKAFEAKEWEEADSLLQEALRVLQQIPKQRRTFGDIFGLQYKLAVCAYHMQEPAEAEEALVSVVQQSAKSDEQRGCIYDAVYLLSHLYIRMGQVDRARSECEKALQARRRLLGKSNNASLESMALMAHIYVLLNNRARAKSYLAMIPEACRDGILKTVEDSLGTKVEHLDSSSLLAQSISADPQVAVRSIPSRLSVSSVPLSAENYYYDPLPAMASQSPAILLRQSYQTMRSDQAGLEHLEPIAARSPLSEGVRRRPISTEKERSRDEYSTDLEGLTALGPGESPKAIKSFSGKSLSRKEILEKVGCQPKDRVEDAVCDGDHAAFTDLLNRKNHFWRLKLRKRVRPERVTALHFAALFGEIDMAQRLLNSSFNINEAPYGYSTCLTPLKFAIGARQVEMVDFLIVNGAKPSAPDSWSTLAELLMNRSWLMKTMSETEKEHVPNRIIAILRILLKHGWDVNAPLEASGGTVLHQAVNFWTGSYRWDMNLRVAITSFLCEQGADPFQANTEGKRPYDMALASGHQDLLLALVKGSKMKVPDSGPAGLAELSI